jgi:hypothetical protein
VAKNNELISQVVVFGIYGLAPGMARRVAPLERPVYDQVLRPQRLFVSKFTSRSSAGDGRGTNRLAVQTPDDAPSEGHHFSAFSRGQ